MCVIISLPAGASINKEHFFNAVHNNWHGYGVILKIDNRLQVIKKFTPEGTNPQEVWDIIEKNKDIERIVHVRYSTKGGTDEENVQPFCVYNSDKRQVWFMHNGTLTSFGQMHNSGKSDTNDFCDKILTPALTRWRGEQGDADYTDPMFNNLIVDKQWTNFSKGMFISNDLPNLRIGNVGMNGWQEYKHPDDSSSGDVWVSNNDYFGKLQRGPRFLAEEAERKAAEAAAKAEEDKGKEVNGQLPFTEGYYPNSSEDGIKIWRNGNGKSPKVVKAINDVINVFDFDDPKVIAKFKFATYDEWVEVIDGQDQYTLAAVLECFSGHIAKLAMENVRLNRKKIKAEIHIEKLSKTIKENKDVCSGDKQAA